MELNGQELSTSARPKQVTYAVYLIYAALAVGFLYSAVSATAYWQATAEQYTNPSTIICFVFGYLYVIFFAVKIAAGRNWARWLYLVEVILSVLSIVGQFGSHIDYPIRASLLALSKGIQLYAIILLFQAPSSAWFKSKKDPEKRENDLDNAFRRADQGHLAPEKGTGNEPIIEEARQIEVTKWVTIAGATGAGIGLMNAVFWTVSLSPATELERRFVYFLIIVGLALGGALGARLGYLYLRAAHRNPSRTPTRWAILGGILGGAVAFVCCWILSAFVLQGG